MPDPASMDTFVEFPKIYRLRRECIVTEKLDGTNAQVIISEHPTAYTFRECGGLWVSAASRSRFIHPAADNCGFARWAYDHANELVKLGTGRHYGEWWGSGIQRGYGLKEKRFSLFNVSRWAAPEGRPECCHVVPILGQCLFSDANAIDSMFEVLRVTGSVAAPGFMRPEGIVIHHVPGCLSFKRTFEKDVEGKGEAREAAQRLVRAS
jgi:hypothetical protein